MILAISDLELDQWGDLTTADQAELLAAERRRTALDELADRTTPVDLDDLATAVALRECDGGPVDGELTGRVAAMLHHVHLPKMRDLGVVEYDPERNRVLSCPDPPD